VIDLQAVGWKIGASLRRRAISVNATRRLDGLLDRVVQRRPPLADYDCDAIEWPKPREHYGGIVMRSRGERGAHSVIRSASVRLAMKATSIAAGVIA
jgi:hypothetical protein